MSKRRTKREKRIRARRSMKGDGDSQYARKRAFCLKNGVWGFEVLPPKPWKRAA